MRPRERMLMDGVSSLNDTELLELLIGSGLRGRSAEIVAGDLLLWCTRFVRECTRAREFVALYAHKLSIHDRVSGTALATSCT